MKIEELFIRINECIDEFDYATARKYIEENIDVLTKHKLSLNSNAREILNFIVEQREAGIQPLSRKEMGIINTINQYAYKFDLRGIKMVLKEHPKIFLRNDVLPYLNSDAKTVLTGMGVIRS